MVFSEPLRPRHIEWVYPEDTKGAVIMGALRCAKCNPVRTTRMCGCCAFAFAAGVLTALLIQSGAATVLVAVCAGCIGIAFIK